MCTGRSSMDPDKKATFSDSTTIHPVQDGCDKHYMDLHGAFKLRVLWLALLPILLVPSAPESPLTCQENRTEHTREAK